MSHRDDLERLGADLLRKSPLIIREVLIVTMSTFILSSAAGKGWFLTLSNLSCPQGKFHDQLLVERLMMIECPYSTKTREVNSGSIGKSIPSSLEISLDPRDFPIPPSFCWSTDTMHYRDIFLGIQWQQEMFPWDSISWYTPKDEHYEHRKHWQCSIKDAIRHTVDICKQAKCQLSIHWLCRLVKILTIFTKPDKNGFDVKQNTNGIPLKMKWMEKRRPILLVESLQKKKVKGFSANTWSAS